MNMKSPINRSDSGGSGGGQDDGSMRFYYLSVVRGGSWSKKTNKQNSKNRKLRIFGVMLMIFQMSFFLQLVSQQTSSLSSIMDDEDIAKLPILWKKYKQAVVEIAIPFCGKPSSLLSFSERLGKSMKNLTSDIDVHLLVTKCKDDTVMENKHFLGLLEDSAGASIETVPLNVTTSRFSRADACNALSDRACSLLNCYFVMVDVDVEISTGFFDNMISYLQSDKVIYYPIIFSEYDPTAVRAAQTIFGRLGPYDYHRGMWRETGYGIYAALGVVVSDLKIEKRVSAKWGGEDMELRKIVQSRGFEIIREREPNLIHNWHDKVCTSDYVDYEYLERCLYTRYMVSGSPVIRYLREADPDFFDYLVFLKPGPNRNNEQGLEWVSRAQEDFNNEEPGYLNE